MILPEECTVFLDGLGKFCLAPSVPPPSVAFRSAASSGEPPGTFESGPRLQLDAAMASLLVTPFVLMVTQCPGLLGWRGLPGCWISVIMLDKPGPNWNKLVILFAIDCWLL